MINEDVILRFLEGRNQKKYIVGVEIPYGSPEVSLIINDPERGKFISKDILTSFLWFKEEVTKIMYGGKRNLISKAAQKYGITIKKLKTRDEDGNESKRMASGYKYIAKSKGSYTKLLKFFKEGGIDVYGQAHKDYFIAINPVEQYLIASGRRLFKGIDDYDDLHRLQFDLETTGLNPKGVLLSEEDKEEIKEQIINGEDVSKLYEFDATGEPLRHKDARIFQIGIRDNRGFEEIIEIPQEGTKEELRELECGAILKFFDIINTLKPDTIAGYNSENFDWHFIFTRCEILNFDIETYAKTLDRKGGSKIKRVDKSIKYGGEREYYKQTMMWGYNILDVYHAVRRAKAINSNIKKAGLKYITKFSRLNKENRVYVKGNKIYEIWADRETVYAFKEEDGTYYKINEENPLKEGYTKVKGNDIIRRYLLDDLWETEKVDGVYNQASFLLSKIIPTSYMRSTTMGTAGIWKLIMLAWSYENRLAIPDFKPRKTFTGGLSRLLEVGYAKNVAKLDFAALYPNIEITWDIFPDTDITGAMKEMLIYVATTRDEFKNLMNEHKAQLNKIIDFKTLKGDKLSKNKLELVNREIEKEKGLVSMYDKKQLPIKILGNSFFGSLGAPNIFNWGDVNCAEETTCRGRQYLRLMVKFFMTLGFKPLVGDSVTFDTPIYIKYKNSGEIDILPICDIFNEITFDIDGQQRDFSDKDFKILTNSGWKELNYVYRHKTDKQIFDIRTRDAHIRVTEDHSIFSDGKKIKPTKLKIGDKIDSLEIPKHNNNNDISINKAWLLGFFVGDGSSVYGDRIQRYKSKKTGNINENMGKRAEWTINNQNLTLLEKAKTILLNEYGIDAPIKNYLESSNTNKLKTHKVWLCKEFSNDCYTSYRQKKVPIKILNSNLEIKKSFLDGFICADGNGFSVEDNASFYQKSITCLGGLTYLLKSLKIDHNIGLKKYHYYKKNLFGLTINTPKKAKLEDLNTIKWKTEFDNKNNFVYDVSTEDGSFIGGVNGVSCSNTDGFNFSIPDGVDKNTYVPEGTHRFTEKEKGNTLIGLKAVVANFNELYMIGRMGLDIDDICESTINFSRKNYANLIDGKVKLVGNTIKSSRLPGYIEEFLDEGIEYLLKGDGYSFVELYNRTVDDIYNFRIPLVKIASKANVKESISAYKKEMLNTTKSGSFKSKKAHMELLISNNIKANLGDTVYYVNTGTVKSHGDVKVVTDKETGKRTVDIQCKLIPTDQIENNPDLTTDEYNVPKYVEAFNKRIHPLLVCFKPEIREEILVSMVRNKKTKEMELVERKVFTKKDCELDSGNAFKDGDQNTLPELMDMEDKEIEFWIRVNKEPNNLKELGMDWKWIQKDYHERERIRRIEGIRFEKSKSLEIIKRLEIDEIQEMKASSEIPLSLSNIADFKVHDDENGKSNIFIVSKEWGIDLAKVTDILKYEPWAKERSLFYQTVKLKKEKTFENWLTNLWLEAKKSGDEKKATKIKKELELAGVELVTDDYKKALEEA